MYRFCRFFPAIIIYFYAVYMCTQIYTFFHSTTPGIHFLNVQFWKTTSFNRFHEIQLSRTHISVSIIKSLNQGWVLLNSWTCPCSFSAALWKWFPVAFFENIWPFSSPSCGQLWWFPNQMLTRFDITQV